MVEKFEKTSSFDVQSDRGRKRIDSTVVEEVVTTMQEESRVGVKPCSARGIAQTLYRPVLTMRKVLRNILHCYPYKISHVQELSLSDLPPRETFALKFLAHMKVDKEKSLKFVDR